MGRAARAVHRLRPSALAAALLVLLAGCGDATPSSNAGKPRRVLDSTAQVEDALEVSGTADQRLLGFLHARYGDNARLDAPWQDQWDDTEVEALRPVTRSVCARDTRDTDGQVQTLLAVCQTLDAAASVEPGRLDLYVLRDGSSVGATEAPLLVIAQRLQGQYGRRGAPGTVALEQLGPHRHAFRITHGQIQRGVTLASRTYVAVHANRLREVAVLREHIDNSAARPCGDAGKGCDDTPFNVDFSIAVGTADAVDGYWPLTVRSRGQDCAGPAHSYDLIAFDAGARRYAVPTELQRAGCAE